MPSPTTLPSLVAFDRAYRAANRDAEDIDALTYEAFCLADQGDLDGAHRALVKAEALALVLPAKVTEARQAVARAMDERSAT